MIRSNRARTNNFIPSYDLGIVQPREVRPLVPVDSSLSGLCYPAPKTSFYATLITGGYPSGKLYVGTNSDVSNADDLYAAGIKRVVNVASAECPTVDAVKRSFDVLGVPLEDHSDEDIAPHFDQCADFIHEGMKAGEGVVVHCRMGVSRSVTIVIAYLMKYGLDGKGKMSYKKAFAHVKDCCVEATPNLGFALSLRGLDATHGFRKDMYSSDNEDED